MKNSVLPLFLIISAYLDIFQVTAKRTNIPGMKQYRPRRTINPYMGGFRGRTPYAPPFIYSPYGYGYTLHSILQFLMCFLFILGQQNNNIFLLIAERFQGSEWQCATAPTIESPILVGWTE